MYGLLIMWH